MFVTYTAKVEDGILDSSRWLPIRGGRVRRMDLPFVTVR